MAEFDIFISYRRVGGFETAKHLYDLLRHDGYAVSFDIDTLREGKFNVALLSRIKMCQDFVLIVDPHTFDRTLDPNFNPDQDWLRQELSYALSLQKNVIPILLAGASFPDELPDDIREVKYMNGPSYSKDYFDSFYSKLKSFLNSKPRGVESPSEPDSHAENKAEIHIDTDTDCEVYRFKEKITETKSGDDNIIYLNRGKHLITFVSKRYPEIKEQISLDIPSLDYSDIVDVRLRSRELETIELYPLCIDNKYGFLDNSNRTQIPFVYEDAQQFSFGLSAVKQNGKYGFINKLGETIIPFIFEEAGTFNESGITPIKENGKYGYIDMNGKIIIPTIYDGATSFSGKIATIRQGNKYGYINKDGTIIIPCIYDTAFPFNDGLAVVRKGLFYGYIDTDGREVIPIKYYGAYNFNCGLARVRHKDRLGPWGYINKDGRDVISPNYQEAYDFSEGRALVQKNYKYGYIDRFGRDVVPIEYGNRFHFKDGLAVVSKENKFGFIDQAGNVIIPFIYDDASSFYEDFASVKKDGKYGFINKYGKVVIPFIYDSVNDFHEGLAVVEKDNLSGFIDKSGQVIISISYDIAYNFDNGFAMVKKDGKYGFINHLGQVVIPIIYDYIYPFGYSVSSGWLIDSPLKNIAIVILNGRLFYIDRQGRKISSTYDNQ